ncbi:hypothetical protein BDB01DRAFT_842040 [Pilobolus umbonatus]|nr:hypothetical protein BDB01DRAFT_842040 [Pilobolus umbonatus]
MKDWTEEFSKYHDLANQERLNMTRNNGNQDWIQQYKKNIIDRKLDKQWHHKTRAWDRLEPEGKPYGYRTIHPEYQTYNYIQNNPYLTRPHAIDAAINNTLADAIMALEAKTQLDPHDAKAWEKLGLKQQENERDAAAITALEKAVSLDPTLLDAWMGLAVGYINEHCRMDSYNCLEQWIVNNQRYKSIVEEDLGAYYSEEEKRHDYITHLFLKAARTMPGEEMDADVQVGLGVLFNMSEEYDKAIDCFRAALISRPEDYQLWNKVGATLANSRDSVGAIEMYFNALQINPSFVRARYNIAISHMNLGQHKEAAEYLLSALALQQEAALSAGQAAGNIDAVNTSNVCGTSDSIWSSLRLLMYMISREDLAAECDHHNLDAFRSSFDF